MWFWEWEDRTKQSHYRAWELINSARGSTGDGGRRDALQDLNEDRVNLSAAPLADAYLGKVQLPNATMATANLSGAILLEADLTGAILFKADLIGAKLTRAKLSGANLTGAILHGAKFCNTIMPDDTLNNRDCSPEPSPTNPTETPRAPK